MSNLSSENIQGVPKLMEHGIRADSDEKIMRCSQIYVSLKDRECHSYNVKFKTLNFLRKGVSA